MSEPFGSTRHHFPVCGSTNDEAFRLAEEGASHGTVCTADMQTSGRGRLGRAWETGQAENLALSIVLRPSWPVARVAPLTIAAGLGVADALADAGVEARLKWPNDVFVGPGKIAGLLAETRTQGAKAEVVVLGIGINVNQPTFAEELHATSLRLATGAPFDRARLLDGVLDHVARWYQRYAAGGVKAVREPWLERAILGPVLWMNGRQEHRGDAVDMADDGALVIRLPSGEVVTVRAGELQWQGFRER